MTDVQEMRTHIITFAKMVYADVVVEVTEGFTVADVIGIAARDIADMPAQIADHEEDWRFAAAGVVVGDHIQYIIA